jgi:hypothetical protein
MNLRDFFKKESKAGLAMNTSLLTLSAVNQHARYDLCLKLLLVAQTGGMRGVKTQGESDYEPTAWSLRRGTPENVFPPRIPPVCATKTFIGHKSITLIKKVLVTFF